MDVDVTLRSTATATCDVAVNGTVEVDAVQGADGTELPGEIVVTLTKMCR